MDEDTLTNLAEKKINICDETAANSIKEASIFYKYIQDVGIWNMMFIIFVISVIAIIVVVLILLAKWMFCTCHLSENHFEFTIRVDKDNEKLL